jgi:hypothetical protein
MLGAADATSQIWRSESLNSTPAATPFFCSFQSILFFSSDAAAATIIPDAMHEHDPVPAIAN